eukprot:1190899-Prorocentrum_minimum.AAC.1
MHMHDLHTGWSISTSGASLSGEMSFEPSKVQVEVMCSRTKRLHVYALDGSPPFGQIPFEAVSLDPLRSGIFGHEIRIKLQGSLLYSQGYSGCD